MRFFVLCVCVSVVAKFGLSLLMVQVMAQEVSETPAETVENQDLQISPSLRTDLYIAQKVNALNEEDQRLYFSLASELRCPTCTGLSVLQSDAPLSLEIKRALLREIEDKKRPYEIMQFFQERYGLWILRKPPRRGFHLLPWLLPVVLLLFAGVWLGLQSRCSFQGAKKGKATSDDMQEKHFHEAMADMAKELSAIEKKLRDPQLG